MNLAEKAYKLIKDEITTCTLEPGQAIAQSQFAKKYKMGLTPVRDALQRLAQEGLVKSVPRFGYIVSPVTFTDVRLLYEFRELLECAAIRLATERASDERLEQIDQSAQFTYTYRDRHSYSEFLSHNAEFHLAIANASENPKLVLALSTALNELTRVFHLGLDLRDSAREMFTEHTALIQAVKARDADRAVQIFQNQNRRSEERVREVLMSKNKLNPILEQTIRVS